MNLTVTHYASNGQEIRPGLRVAHRSHQQPISFSVDVVCGAGPNEWFGEVLFAGQTLLRTEAFQTEEGAGRAAEQALSARIVALFSAE